MHRCSNVAGLECAVEACIGRADPKACEHHRRLTDWRALGHAGQLAVMDSRQASLTPLAIDPAIRDAVNACPARGGELPVSAYILEGCCAGPTRNTCSAGKGRVKGQPTLENCFECKATERAAS